MKPPHDAPRPPFEIDEFLGEPPRDLAAWRWLWEGDRSFPIRSHRRGLLGRLIVGCKRLLRPVVQIAAADLWDRQRIYNVVLLDHLRRLESRYGERLERLEAKTAHLEAFLSEGLDDLMRYDDALYSRVDQKLDRYRRQAEELAALLGAALARAESLDGAAALSRAVEDRHYLELERRHRGTPAEIRDRFAAHLPLLEGRRRVLDLGCGRGEGLALLRERGIGALGVDWSAEMVRRCADAGLEAVEGDLVQYLRERQEGSCDGVIALHVIEHLSRLDLQRLVHLAWRALEPGGIVLLETPNPLSIVVAATRFWRDPTHRRPIHPDALRLALEQAGFRDVEVRYLHPFADEERLPEISLDGLAGSERRLAHRLNVLRDRLDESLYGYQDYAVVGVKRPPV